MSPKKFAQLATVMVALVLGVWLVVRPSQLRPESISRITALRALAPAGNAQGEAAAAPTGQRIVYDAVTPTVKNFADVDPNAPHGDSMYDRWLRGEIDLDENDSILSAAEVAALQEAAMRMGATAGVQLAESGPGLRAPVPAGVSFASIDYNGGGGSTPPDPEMAVGPNHIIAVVNVAVAIYDKSGTTLLGPVPAGSLYSGASCVSGLYDPNVLYDEEADRFIIAFDKGAFSANGGYCLLASQTGNPLGTWNEYFFPLNSSAGWLDYPHAGVGDNHIFMGGNIFTLGGSFVEGRIYAFNKANLYSGAATAAIALGLGNTYDTPQPINLHGSSTNTWPNWGNKHYFMAEPYDGINYTLFEWDTVTLTNRGNLAIGTGGMPVQVVQSGGSNIQANDWRPLDFEYRNGYGWTTATNSCNPGSGTVNCLVWAQVDLDNAALGPAGSGVYGSNGDHRFFPDLAVNHCNDMALGYTKSNSSIFPSVWVTGRESGDPAGQLQAEIEMKAGEITYLAFDSPPRRWGDYTGMTIDPDGLTFWYLGEYSKVTGNVNGRWGNYIGSFTYPNCVISTNPSITLVKTVGTNPAVCATTDVITVTVGTDVTYCYEVTNDGDTTLNLHNLIDSELGSILNTFAYALTPGASAFLTATTTMMATTTNTATWTAYNANASYTFDDTAPYNFIDISATGTPLNLTDDGEANVTMPFQFNFYGTTSDLLRVGNNGGILFATTTGDVGFTNAALPNAAHPLAIFPFWDDLDDELGNVYYETVGAAPNRTFIVQWHERPHFPGSATADTVTFQVILAEGINEILFQYADLDFGDPAFNYGASATVGLNKDATTAVQYSFNSAVLSDGLAIRWTPTGTASASDSATVNVLTPEIVVTPAELDISQPMTTTVAYSLAIGNAGDGPLDWTILEYNPLRLQPQPVAPNPSADPAQAREHSVTAGTYTPAEAALPAYSAWNWPTAVLYDNGPLVTNPGAGFGGADASALQTNLGLSIFGFGHAVASGFRVADDFTVPADGWFIDTITFFAYQTGSTTTSTINSVNLRIWDGPPGEPGSSVVYGDTTTNRLTSSNWTNMYRVTDTALGADSRPVMANVVTVNTILPAGDYWLDWQTGGTLASGPWAPPVSILGQTGKPGANGRQFDPGPALWSPLIDGPAVQDLPFVIQGQIVPFPCLTPSDIPWLTLDVTAGSTAAGGSSSVQATIDSAGLAAGLYTGTLCINSNDPVTPLVTVPLTLTVVPQSFGVLLSADQAASSDAGMTVTYTIQITNTGNVADTFNLAATGGAWTTTLGSSSVTLAAGASAAVVVQVAVPANAADGTSDVVTITAVSQSDSGVSDTLTLTTTAVVPIRYLYLPLILRP